MGAALLDGGVWSSLEATVGRNSSVRLTQQYSYAVADIEDSIILTRGRLWRLCRYDDDRGRWRGSFVGGSKEAAEHGSQYKKKKLKCLAAELRCFMTDEMPYGTMDGTWAAASRAKAHSIHLIDSQAYNSVK